MQRIAVAAAEARSFERAAIVMKMSAIMLAKTVERVVHEVGPELAERRELSRTDDALAMRPASPPELAVVECHGGRILTPRAGIWSSVGSTLFFGVHGFARFLSNGGGHSDPRRGVMNKRYLVKLDKDERKELSQLVKKERIAAKKRTPRPSAVVGRCWQARVRPGRTRPLLSLPSDGANGRKHPQASGAWKAWRQP